MHLQVTAAHKLYRHYWQVNLRGLEKFTHLILIVRLKTASELKFKVFGNEFLTYMLSKKVVANTQVLLLFSRSHAVEGL